MAAGLAQILQIDPSDLGIRYDPATQSIAYHLSIQDTLPALTLPLDFSVHAGTLASFTTSSTVSAQAQFKLDLDFGAKIDSLITGDALAHDFFLENVALNGAITIGASDITASARIGSFGIHSTGGTASATGTVKLTLKDTGTDAADGKLSLAELASAGRRRNNC